MEEEWFGEGYEQRKSSFWVHWFEVWNNRKTLGRLTSWSVTGNRLLEIGVGSGSFLKAAQEHGYDVMGCDLSPPICKRVENEHGILMYCGPLASLKSDGHFDVVVMNHVLEHVQQPTKLLEDVMRLLVPGGILHIAVPNIACWEARLSGWTSYEPYHLIYFDQKTLTKSVKEAGFSLDYIITHDSFSGWFLALLRTVLGVNRKQGALAGPNDLPADRATKRRSGLVEHSYRIAMILSGGGLLPLRWLQGKLGYGDEVICSAHKPIIMATN